MTRAKDVNQRLKFSGFRDLRNSQRQSAYDLAVASHSGECVDLLLDATTFLKAPSPIHAEIEAERPEEWSADQVLANKDRRWGYDNGLTMLMVAAIHGMRQAVDVLIGANADIHAIFDPAKASGGKSDPFTALSFAAAG